MKHVYTFVVTIIVLGCQSSESHIAKKSFPFDVPAIMALRATDGKPVEERSKWLLCAYVPKLSCSTCTNRDLKYLAEMKRRHSDYIDFLLICHGGNREYVRNIRRIGRVDFPILIEEKEGSLGFTPHFHFMLVDKELDMSVLQYYPVSTLSLERGIIPFEQEILKYIGYK